MDCIRNLAKTVFFSLDLFISVGSENQVQVRKSGSGQKVRFRRSASDHKVHTFEHTGVCKISARPTVLLLRFIESLLHI